MKLVIALLLFSIIPAQAASLLHLASYGADLAGCALSFTDAWSTKAVIDAGGRETNMLFAGPQKGGISWGKIISYKMIQCGSPFVLHAVYHRLHVSDRTADESALTTGLVAVGTYAWATKHNTDLAGQLRAAARAQSAANLK